MKLLEEIENEMNWRVGDFARIKMLGSHFKETNLEQLVLRMSIPMIYAHWEGFVVQAFSLIVEYLNKQEYRYSDLELSVFICAVEKEFDYLKGKSSFDQICRFSNGFFDILSNPVKFSKKIDTKSNLRFNIFCDLCTKFLIPVSNFESYKFELDRLVNIRNQIAHGENGVTITYEMRDESINAITSLMELFTLEIDDYVSGGKFIKAS